MKKLYMLYGAMACALIIVIVVLVKLGQITPTSGAINKLGKSDRLYLEAREEILMGSGDAITPLIKFVLNRRASHKGRVQAVNLLTEIITRQNTQIDSRMLVSLLDDTLPSMRIAALQLFSKVNDTSAIGKITEIFTKCSDTLVCQKAYAALNASVKYYVDQTDTALGKKDTVLMRTAISKIASVPVAHFKSYNNAISLYRLNGDTASVNRFKEDLALIRQFVSVGPFILDWGKGYDNLFPPNTQPFSRNDKFAIAGGEQAGWEIIEAKTENDGIAYPASIKQSTVFLFTKVTLPEAAELILYIGCQEGMKVWWNGECVRRDKTGHIWVPDQYAIKANGLKGENTLLIRFDCIMGNPVMSCRLTDKNGHVIPGMRIHTD